MYLWIIDSDSDLSTFSLTLFIYIWIYVCDIFITLLNGIKSKCSVGGLWRTLLELLDHMSADETIFIYDPVTDDMWSWLKLYTDLSYSVYSLQSKYCQANVVYFINLTSPIPNQIGMSLIQIVSYSFHSFLPPLQLFQLRRLKKVTELIPNPQSKSFLYCEPTRRAFHIGLATCSQIYTASSPCCTVIYKSLQPPDSESHGTK